MNAPTRHHSKQAALREFDRWAHNYDRSVLQHLVFKPTYEALLEEVARWRFGLNGRADRPFDVLDIGCGTGSWAAMLRGSTLPVRVVGLDYSPEMCRRSARKARELLIDGLDFVNGDSEHLPFADGRFDLVTCSHSFHHYPHQAAVVREMRRVLRPGGRLMLCDGFRDNVIGWVIYDVFVARIEGNVHHAPWSEIRSLFIQAGFEDIEQRKFNVWAPVLLTMGSVPSLAGAGT